MEINMDVINFNEEVIDRAKELGLPEDIASMPITYYYKAEDEDVLEGYEGTVYPLTSSIPYNKELENYLNEKTIEVITKIKDLSNRGVNVRKELINEYYDLYPRHVDHYVRLGGHYKAIIGGPLDGKCLVRSNQEDEEHVLPSSCIRPLFLFYMGDIKFSSNQWFISVKESIDNPIGVVMTSIGGSTEYLIEYCNEGKYRLRGKKDNELIFNETQGTLESCISSKELIQKVYNKGFTHGVNNVLKHIEFLIKSVNKD